MLILRDKFVYIGLVQLTMYMKNNNVGICYKK